MTPAAVRYHVIHETLYVYENPVSVSRQQLHLTPRDCPWQHIVAHEITVTPPPTLSHSSLDHLGNPIRQFAIEAPHSRLRVCAESTIDVRSHLPLPLADSPAWERVRDALAFGAKPVHLEANSYLFESPYVRVKREFLAYAKSSFVPGRPLLEAVEALMNRIHTEFTFDSAATTVATPVLKVLEERRGVCQDFAHLMLSCLRSLGLAARYVSGYLLTQPPPGQPRLTGADASHAWVSVFCPHPDGNIWVDFDPTNNCLPDTQHITLAWGRDFGDVSPLRGVILGGDGHEPVVAVTVTPIEDSLDECVRA